MKNNDIKGQNNLEERWSPLELVIRQGAQSMLQAALEYEVAEFLEIYKPIKDQSGNQSVTRNGHHPSREIMTGIGGIGIKQPRVDDRAIRKDKATSEFTSKLIPKYMRKVPSIENLLPILYLKGISTNDFASALSAILGENAKNVSANVIVKLKTKWEEEYRLWQKEDLSKKEYVYIWADGVHFNVRLEEDRTCFLVIIGVDRDGNKELIAVSDGYRESVQSWKEVLLDLKGRGLTIEPKLAIGDGAMGFWSALRAVYSATKEQRCWVHKTANILDKLPKRIQPKAKQSILDMYQSETKEEALKAYDKFLKTYEDKYPKATKCLSKDKEQLFTFYSFPAGHWRHIRTSNPIESTFATVRLRTKRTKGMATRITTLTMVWKLGKEAQKRWIKIHAYPKLELVWNGMSFIDGLLVNPSDNLAA